MSTFEPIWLARVWGLVKVLLVQIYWKASAIFSTTHVGAGPLVRKFTKTANEYFLDETGSAIVAETLQLWRINVALSSQEIRSS